MQTEMANTRIVVKNLPKKVTEAKIREVFSAKGKLTDVDMRFTKSGNFRQFAFLGYCTEEEAAATMKFFHQSFMGASQLKVELCRNLDDPDKPKSWSKHSKGTAVHHKNSTSSISVKYNKLKGEQFKNESNKDETAQPNITERKSATGPKNKEVSEIFDKYKDDPHFAEFLQVNRRGGRKVLWSNDVNEGQEEDINSTNAQNNKPSDLEYLKSKIVKTNADTSDEDEDKNGVNNDKKQLEDKQLKLKTEFTVKLRGQFWRCKKKDIRQFFEPLKPVQIRFVKIKQASVVYVKFSSDSEVKQALTRSRGFLDGHRIEVVDVNDTTANPTAEENGDKWEKLTSNLERNAEAIEESGSIFIRNLAYTVTQDDLEQLLGKYGPLADVRIPVDRFTRKIKGFAMVDYVLPEHATKAFAELDGQIFQGRYLHILPGMPKPKPKDDGNEQSSYKAKKSSQQKAISSSSHNWNTLFLGANAVADIMTQKYNTTKQNLLNPESDNLAVRMALGETQLVVETRNFLLFNGIQLEAFGQPSTERSKTVFLVKNLPANTTEDALWKLFSPYGQMGRVILPPSGVTAVVEFLHPTEARQAFRSLAYTKFNDVPLYLEWAPMKIFSTSTTSGIGELKKEEKSTEDGSKIGDKSGENQNKDEIQEESDSGDGEPESGANVFVKNLNFETTDERLAEHFKKYGPIISATISRKRDFKNPGNLLSLGYGFVQFRTKSDAQRALKELQHSVLDDHTVELKISDRTVTPKIGIKSRKKSTAKKQTSTKILVRNIPFEAKTEEVAMLFRTFGELKGVRLPKKMVGTGSHRGFAFVDFVTRADAKRAFEALCHSTHLYGRRLVLEWASVEDQDVDALRRKTAAEFYEGVPAPKKMRKAIILEQLDSMKNNDESGGE